MREAEIDEYLKKFHWERNILEKYGIREEEYNRLFTEQSGRCVICNTHQKNLSRRLSVDHNHSTGKVRGLLCGNCNFLIGYAKENTLILTSAISYLEKHKVFG